MNIQLVARKGAAGLTKTLLNGARVAAQADTDYRLIIDGADRLPPGTRFERHGADLVVVFPSGERIVLADWQGAERSTLNEFEPTGASPVVADPHAGSDLSVANSLGEPLAQLDSAAAAPLAGTAGAQASADTVDAGAAKTPVWVPIVAGVGAVGVIAAAASSGGSDSAAAPAPPPPAPASSPTGAALSASSDSGKAGDGVTNINQLTITGHGVAGDTVVLLDGSNKVGTAQVNADGTWSVTSSALTDGFHSLFVYEQTPAGGKSSNVTVGNFTIDTTPPTANAEGARLNEDFAPTTLNTLQLGVSDTQADPATLVLSKASFGSSSAFSSADVIITTNDNNTLTFELTPSGANKNGQFTVLADITDPAGNVAQHKSMLITVDAINDPAVIGDSNVLVNRLVPSTSVVSKSFFNYSDADGDAITSVDITKLPADGKLVLDGKDQTDVFSVTAAELDAGKLIFDHSGGVVGKTSFDVNINSATEKGTATVNLHAFDPVLGDGGTNTLFATTIAPAAYGFGGNDAIGGSAGQDSLWGDWRLDDSGIVRPPGETAGKDTLDGQGGDDLLVGGGDDDTLTGGTGRDVFVYRGAGSEGKDVIQDFVVGTDVIRIHDVTDKAALNFSADSANGSSPIFKFGAPGAQTEVTIVGVPELFNKSLDQLILDGVIVLDPAAPRSV